MGGIRRGGQVVTALRVERRPPKAWCMDRWDIAVKEIGCLAKPRLKGHSRGAVCAVFSRSFYVELSGGLVCLANVGLGSCPLNLAAAVPVTTDWCASGVAVDDAATVIGPKLHVGARLTFDLSGAVDWEPALLSTPPDPSQIALGLKLFREMARGRLPVQGLGCLLGFENEPDNEMARRVQPELSDLCRWLADGGTPGSVPVSTILGAGPGLTPSGDDFIGGMMIALTLVGQGKIRDRLWRAIYPCAVQSGNRISYAHLEAAALGYGHAALHRAIHAISINDTSRIVASVRDLGSIGATSGWDAMAGAALVLEVLPYVTHQVEGASARLSI